MHPKTFAVSATGSDAWGGEPRQRQPGLSSTGQRADPAVAARLGALLALAWMAGVGWQLQQPALTTQLAPPGWVLAAVLALAGGVAGGCEAVAGMASAQGRRHHAARWRRGLLAGLAAAAVGLVAFHGTQWRAAQRLADRLPAALEGVDLVVTGTVAELPRRTATSVRFVLAVTSARTMQGEAVEGVPSRLSLGFYPRDGERASAPARMGVPVPSSLQTRGGLGPREGTSRPALDVPRDALRVRTDAPDASDAPHEVPAAWADAPRAGERWRLPVRLKRPHGGVNPHGFDLERWLFEQRLGATGSVRPGAVRLEAAAAHPVARWREHLRTAIFAAVPDPSAAGVVAALAIGDQSSIDSAGWERFRITGVAHLMSISGLHVTMFAWAAGLGVGWIWRRRAAWMIAVPAPQAARWGGLALALGYAVLAGLGVPAQRTVFMLAVVVGLRAAALRWPAPGVLLAAAVAVTVWDPWALLQPGFWMSFVAVGVLIVAEGAQAPGRSAGVTDPPGHRAAAAVGALLRTQAVTTVGLAPWTLLCFQQVSLVGFVANLVAIPFVTLVVTPLSLLGVLLEPAWVIAALAVQALSWVLAVMAGWSWAVWAAAEPAFPWFVAGLLGAALAVLPLPWTLRGLALPLLLPMAAPEVDRPAHGRFEVVMPDVGQGGAALVRTRRHLLLFDAGPQYTPQADAGQRVLLPLLRGRGEKAIDMLVLSHHDADHIGGADALLNALPVRQVLSSLTLERAAAAWPPGLAARQSVALGDVIARIDPARHRACQAGQAWTWDGVRFEVLHPVGPEEVAGGPGGRRGARTVSANARSCVLRVIAADEASLLLTGDIEVAQERELLARSGPALRSTVVVAPHHGSKGSSSPAFVEAVAPRAAVFQAAYRSRFGHPAPDVLARYEATGAVLVRSDRCGAWTWRSGDASGVCERERRRRYWHWQPVPAQASPEREP